MRTNRKRPRPVWLLDIPNPDAKRIRDGLDPAAECRRLAGASLPGSAEFDRDDPLAVFLGLGLWREILAGVRLQPEWLPLARKILVASASAPPAREDEVLAHGFLACLPAAAPRARIKAALTRAADSVRVFDDILATLGEAMRDLDNAAQENGRLAFFQYLLARASRTLDLAEMLVHLHEDLALAFPVGEILAVFWEQDQTDELFLEDGLAPEARDERDALLRDLAARIRGSRAAKATPHAIPVAASRGLSPLEPSRGLIVPLSHEGRAFGCLIAVFQGGLAKLEQETARQAVLQTAPCLRHALAYLSLARRAVTDDLTGLANRGAFDAQLSRELKRHQRHGGGFSLLMADIDHFKAVNDTHGHLAGDAALIAVAQTLRESLRETDFVARFGGEEFAMILPYTGQAQAWMLAERLRRRVAALHLVHAGREIPLTVSLGLAGFAPGDAHTETDLVALADQALYASKALGRNRISLAPADRRLRVPRTGSQAG